jgi:hypothetical protein
LVVRDLAAHVAAAGDLGSGTATLRHHPANFLEIVPEEAVEIVFQIPQLPLRPELFERLYDPTHGH